MESWRKIPLKIGSIFIEIFGSASSSRVTTLVGITRCQLQVRVSSRAIAYRWRCVCFWVQVEKAKQKQKTAGSQVVVMTFSRHAKDATRVLGRPGNTWQCLFVRLYNLLVCRYDSISHCKIWESTNHWPRHVDSVSFSRMDFVCTSWLVGYHHNKKDFGTTTSVRLHWSPVQNLEAR